MPIRPRRTRPSRIRRPATNLAVLMAIAKQIPWAGRIMAVLTPITWPRESTSGPPELPGIERRVGLEHVVDQPARAGPERSAQGADDAGGDRALEAVRVADRQGELADAHLLRVAQRGRDEVPGVDADHGQVGLGVVADQVGLVLAAVGQRDLEPLGPVDDVAVGQDVSARGEDESRAAPPVRPVAGRDRANRASMWTTDGPTRSAAPTTARE